MGRIPTELYEAEGVTPSQLSHYLATESKQAMVLKKMAVRAHICTRRHTGLLCDIALCEQPSEGPIQPSERRV